MDGYQFAKWGKYCVMRTKYNVSTVAGGSNKSTSAVLPETRVIDINCTIMKGQGGNISIVVPPYPLIQYLHFQLCAVYRGTKTKWKIMEINV
jgi:hypothetical protein